MSFLEKCLFRSSAYFLIELLASFILDCHMHYFKKNDSYLNSKGAIFKKKLHNEECIDIRVYTYS